MGRGTRLTASSRALRPPWGCARASGCVLTAPAGSGREARGASWEVNFRRVQGPSEGVCVRRCVRVRYCDRDNTSNRISERNPACDCDLGSICESGAK